MASPRPRTVLHRLGGRDGALDTNLAAVIATQDAVILGRRSYDEWSAYWPGSAIEPFATFINGVTKYVATSTPLGNQWANATAIDGGLVPFVAGLKASPGGDIGVHASIAVARALLAADVIDEDTARRRPDDRRPRAPAFGRVAAAAPRRARQRDVASGVPAGPLSCHPVMREMPPRAARSCLGRRS